MRVALLLLICCVVSLKVDGSPSSKNKLDVEKEKQSYGFNYGLLLNYRSPEPVNQPPQQEKTHKPETASQKILTQKTRAIKPRGAVNYGKGVKKVSGILQNFLENEIRIAKESLEVVKKHRDEEIKRIEEKLKILEKYFGAFKAIAG